MKMEIPFMDHVRHSLMIDRNKDVIIDKLLNLTLEIICLLTGEDYIVMRKSGEPRAAEKKGRRVSDTCIEAQSLITVGSPVSPVTAENPARRIPAPAKEPYTENLPIKCEDGAASAWDCSAEQVDAAVVGGLETRCSADSARIQRILEPSGRVHQDGADPKTNHVSAVLSTGSPPRKCWTPLCSQDCSTQESQAEPPGDGRIPQFCKDEATSPDDVDSGGEDSADGRHQCRVLACTEDITEEESEVMALEDQSDVSVWIRQQPCKEEAAPDYILPGPAVSSLHAVTLRHCSQVRGPVPDDSDPAASLCTDNLLFCSICGVHFGSETTFAAHQRFHTEEKSYDCTYCGKSFNQRSRLLSHKRKHTGEKPFSCPVCGRCFAERSALVTHQRIHSGEKPFNCTECARSFVQRSSLVKHQRIHTGERPFVCSQCGRCFSQSSNLVRHQRILHQFL
ncbi:uncharacterized protein ACNLHF_010793 [Anomaloglossus baeobatrachus]|uniref:uncharacterized protein LOC142292329 n=1 Tax=Anomaloglossus baeobatrachus TaxID=238106 RepID=UPI003F4FF61B